jgi:acetyltransferase
LFAPKAIALVGASNREHSVGAVVAHNLLGAGFAGPVLTVNPHETAIQSTLNYRTVADLPLTPDLAVLATPPATVPGLIAELGQRGCRAAVVLTAGFGEGDRAEGRALRQAMLEAARPNLMRIIGPNCLGVISTGQRINASFAPAMPATGDVALVTQSGAIATSLLDWAAANGVGFSNIVSLGDMSDVDFGDLLDYLALDRGTRAILLYVESVTSARKFMSAARIAARAKPVIVVKSGRSAGAARAARSHTGALAGSDLVYDAAFRRAGMLRVKELRELFQALVSISSGIRLRGDRLTILTNGGGAGVLAVDALEEQGGRLASLSPATIEALSAHLPDAWSRANPVDILGDATGERYANALAVLMSEAEQEAVLVLNCPTAVADSDEAAAAVVKRATEDTGTPILTCWLGEATAETSRRRLTANGIPTYETPEEAVQAFMHLVRYQRNQALLLETPGDRGVGNVDQAAVRVILDAARRRSQTILSEVDAKNVLRAYGIPTAETIVAADAAEAGRAAARIGGLVALKILSPDITHKSDVGGVRLDLDPPRVEAAAEAMRRDVGGKAPGAKLTGFTVAPMIKRPHARELLLGISRDATFGPVILFGEGGTAAEVIAERAVALPPLNSVLARDLIGRTRTARLLSAYRDRPAVDETALEATLMRLSQLALDFPEIAELDINPLLADEAGVIALDARIITGDAAGAVRSAIAPYPGALVRPLDIQGIGRLTVRPIRPEDEPLLLDMIRRSDPEHVRLRFFAPIPESHALGARLTQIDYDREMALVAIREHGGEKGDELLGVGRLISDPDNEKGEFAVMVRSDVKGRGLGYALMRDILAYARERELKCVFGDVLSENKTMLAMARELGFSIVQGATPGIVKVRLELASANPTSS